MEWEEGALDTEIYEALQKTIILKRGRTYFRYLWLSPTWPHLERQDVGWVKSLDFCRLVQCPGATF